MKNLIRYSLGNLKHPLMIISNHINLGSDPKVIYANKEFLEKNNINLEDIVDESFCKILNLENHQDMYSDIITSLKENKKWSGPIIVNEENFIVKYFEITPVRDIENNTLYYFVIENTLDMLKEEEEDKEVSSEKHQLDKIIEMTFLKYDLFKDFSENLDSYLWKIDLLGNITYLNKKIKEDFNLELYKNVNEYLKDDSLKAINEQMKSNGNMNKIDNIRLEFKGDTNKTVCCRYWPIYFNDIIVGFGGTLKDVTYKAKILKNLMALKEEK